MAPRVKVLPTPIVSQLMFSQLDISIEEHKLLGRFYILASIRFLGAHGEDPYEFLISYKDRL